VIDHIFLLCFILSKSMPKNVPFLKKNQDDVVLVCNLLILCLRNKKEIDPSLFNQTEEKTHDKMIIVVYRLEVDA
jgi:hypothetical protein